MVHGWYTYVYINYLWRYITYTSKIYYTRAIYLYQ